MTNTISVPTYGSTFYNPKTGVAEGINKFDPNTGKALTPVVSAPVAVTNTTSTPKVSTTTLSNTNKINAIPSITANTTALADKGVRTDPKTGVATYANGTVYNPPATETNVQNTTRTSSDNLEANVSADTTIEDDAIMKNLETMQAMNDSATSSLIANIRQKFDQRKKEQAELNAKSNKNMQNSLLMGGVTGKGSNAQYASISSEGIVAAQENYGIKQLAELDSQEQDLIAAALQAQKDGNFKILEQKNAQIEAKRKEKIDIATKLNEEITKRNNEMRKQNEAIDKENAINEVYSAGVNDVPTILAELNKRGYKATAKEVSDTVGLLSGIGGSGIVGEYNFYKSEAMRNGQIPMSFNAYQDMDANRKKSIAKAGAATYGGYDTNQQKAIDQINTSISNNPSYKKFVSMQTYANNVEAGLSQGSGIGDIAAINQFQKVIDEGAVTRDQDVHLIQGAQSLASQLQTKIKKLQNGDQLSPEQRRQMLDLTTKMLTTQQNALNKDPSLVAQNKKAERYKVDPSETILGEITNNASKATANTVIQQENDAKTKVINYGSANPAFQPIILKKVNEINPYTGQKYTYSELLQIYPEIK